MEKLGNHCQTRLKRKRWRQAYFVRYSRCMSVNLAFRSSVELLRLEEYWSLQSTPSWLKCVSKELLDLTIGLKTVDVIPFPMSILFQLLKAKV